MTTMGITYRYDSFRGLWIAADPDGRRGYGVNRSEALMDLLLKTPRDYTKPAGCDERPLDADDWPKN